MRKDMLNKLREDPLYKLALKSVDKEQAEKIAQFVEGWLSIVADNMEHLAERVKTDPKFSTEISQTLQDQIKNNNQ